MPGRDCHDLYLRGLMSAMDQDHYEALVCDRRQMAQELHERLSGGEGWEVEMVARARALLAVRDTFIGTGPAETSSGDGEAPPSDELFSWPVETAARTLQERTVIRLVNIIVVRAIQDGVDHVEIRPGNPDVEVWALGQPVSQKMMTVPESLLSLLLARLRLLAHIDPAAPAQAGHLPVSYCGSDFEVHVRIGAGPAGATTLDFERGVA